MLKQLKIKIKTMFFYNNSKLDRLFDNIVSISEPVFNHVNGYAKLPIVSRDSKGYNIEFTLPGYEKEDLEISIVDECLIIKSSNDILDQFEKSYTLPEGIDLESCTAKMKAGILNIKFKFKKELEPETIKIKIK